MLETTRFTIQLVNNQPLLSLPQRKTGYGGQTGEYVLNRYQKQRGSNWQLTTFVRQMWKVLSISRNGLTLQGQWDLKYQFRSFFMWTLMDLHLKISRSNYLQEDALDTQWLMAQNVVCLPDKPGFSLIQYCQW